MLCRYYDPACRVWSPSVLELPLAFTPACKKTWRVDNALTPPLQACKRWMVANEFDPSLHIWTAAARRQKCMKSVNEGTMTGKEWMDMVDCALYRTSTLCRARHLLESDIHFNLQSSIFSLQSSVFSL